MPNKGKGKGKAVMAAPPVTCQQDCSGCGPRCPQTAIQRGVMAQKMFVGATEQLMKGLAIWLVDIRDRNETAGTAVRAARLLLDTLPGTGTAGYSISDFERKLHIWGERMGAPTTKVTASTQSTQTARGVRRSQQDFLKGIDNLSLATTYELGREGEDGNDTQTTRDVATDPSPLPLFGKEVAMEATSSTGKTYAEAAEQAVSLFPEVPRDDTQGQTISEESEEEETSTHQSPCVSKAGTSNTLVSSVKAQAVVMHGVPTRYKPGQMRRWIEEDNKGVEVMGIRWLLKQHEPGKVASSLVVYTRSAKEVGRLYMGRKFFRTTRYDWNRLSSGRRGKRATLPTGAASPTRSTTTDETCMLCQGGERGCPVCEGSGRVYVLDALP
ncbi:hypothetical protein EV426DRAFT_701977 [Tirmania nivea]|nr:hypothetical protein EV426DRAFT_701977 [Tirmania nivea]